MYDSRDGVQGVLPQNMKEQTEFPQYIKMDYSLKTIDERVDKVAEIIENTPSEKLTPYYLDKLTKYIVEPIERQERKEKYILTDNHMKNINEREMSFEGLVGKLENGEDGIYNMIANDKNIIFHHNTNITQQDLDSIPELKQLYDAIKRIEKISKTARGKKAYTLKKQLIEMYKDQYEIKNAFKPVIRLRKTSNAAIKNLSKIDLSENITINEKGQVESDGVINLYNEKHISLLLCNYSKIKEECWDKFQSDIKWLMEDLDNLVDAALKEKYPMYYDLLIYKIDGKQNAEIQELLFNDYGIKHSVEYISSLWRNKIPRLIAEEATNQYLIWYFTFEEKGKWKKCSRCGQIKLAHNNFFSKNNTSKDHFYSICKECRNKKNK